MQYDLFVEQLNQLDIPDAIIDQDVLVIDFRPSKGHWLSGQLLHTVQVMVRYSMVYYEPELLMRFWTSYEDDGIEVIGPCYTVDSSSVLGIPAEFVVELDVNINESDKRYSSKYWGAWYSIHPCDTAEIIGNDVRYMDTYLKRWTSVFLMWLYEL
ncbi:Ubiquitin-like-conjugating enzyme ATG10 [Nakaseomyces bracarensis]|uniref:Ubiquitin-like-conjugating enzyme ATG10 n=1 Tax=Nakaseomyces bracarensis TaxID=273131 RepID=A0ABR4NSK9_9SACH